MLSRTEPSPPHNVLSRHCGKPGRVPHRPGLLLLPIHSCLLSPVVKAPFPTWLILDNSLCPKQDTIAVSLCLNLQARLLCVLPSTPSNVLLGDPRHDSDQGVDLVLSLSKSAKRSRNYRANLGQALHCVIGPFSVFWSLSLAAFSYSFNNGQLLPLPSSRPPCLAGAPSSPYLSYYRTSTLCVMFIQSAKRYLDPGAFRLPTH